MAAWMGKFFAMIRSHEQKASDLQRGLVAQPDWTNGSASRALILCVRRLWLRALNKTDRHLGKLDRIALKVLSVQGVWVASTGPTMSALGVSWP